MAAEIIPDPVRLCCGQRHQGAVCPDGLVQCCICFHRFPIEGLYVDEQHDRWDVCLGCRAAEVEAMRRRSHRWEERR
jgi:hypothetical protein